MKQTAAVIVAYCLTELGVWLSVALPTELALFTGSDVEALLSAGIAMAIHAGTKAAGNPTARQLLTVLLFVFLPASAACQTGTATVTVIDRSLLEVTVEPPEYTGEVGDTVTFSAVAVDTVSGDTIPAQIRWSSEDTTGVSIDPVSGLATLLRAGTYSVIAEVTEIVSVIFLSQEDDGTWREVYSSERESFYAETGYVPDPLFVTSDQWRPLCAYLEFADGLILLDLEGHYNHEWGIRADTFTGSGTPVGHDEGGPRSFTTTASNGLASPTSMPDCPAFESVLPLVPMEFQLALFQTTRPS